MRQIGMTAVLVLIAGTLGFALRGCTLFNPPNTLVSLSPDDRWRVTLIERRLDVDRNFQLRLEDVKTGKVRVIFRSPDEGFPVGSERIVWSADGSRFLLLGRHFYKADATRLSSGEQLYLMMDLQSGKISCNGHQQSDYPAFSIDDVRATTWVGWSPE